jgi:rubrerythrin
MHENRKKYVIKSTIMKKYVCTVCGYVHYGEQPPSVCPVCKQPASKFKEQPNDQNKENKSIFEKIKGLFK